MSEMVERDTVMTEGRECAMGTAHKSSDKRLGEHEGGLTMVVQARGGVAQWQLQWQVGSSPEPPWTAIAAETRMRTCGHVGVKW
jgi:hypothetical protein